MDNKVKFLRGTATEYEASTKDNDTFYYTTDDEKLYLGNKEITGGGVTIDDTLSDTSKNPVQNKVINAALNSKANLSDIPTSLPANGGNADTVDGKHASDFALKTDIPTTLPANGGNADTLDGLHAGSFLGSGVFEYWSSGGDANSITHDFHGFVFNAPNTPFGYCFLDVRMANAAGFAPNAQQPIIVQTAICYNTSQVAIRQSVNNGNTWADWTLLSDGGNAATVNGLTVQTAVPANAKFTDTTYGNASASAPGLVSTGAQTLAGNKTFNGQVIPAGASAVGTAQARKIYAGTSDMTAGTTALETGAIYLVYE